MPIVKATGSHPQPGPLNDLDTDALDATPEPTKKPRLRRPGRADDGADDFWNGLT
jgi:hypothetical protein